MTEDRSSRIRREIQDHLDVLARVRDTMVALISEAADGLVSAFRSHHRVLLFGNGGSFSDALHIEGELTNRFRRERPGLPALTLGASLASLTSTANDYSYEEVFARQMEAHGQKGDVAIGLTTSGRSPNVVAGLRKGRMMGLMTIALTGEDGGAAAQHADLLLAVPSRSTPRIQEAHIVIGHMICQLVEDRLFGD